MQNKKLPIRYSVYNPKGIWQASYSTELGAKTAFKYAKICVTQTGGEIVAVFPHDPHAEISIFKHKLKKRLKK
tara:strand:+ start:110 stop:328 length:219 start_codon:yes stop_codon:yes gene_type:complete